MRNKSVATIIGLALVGIAAFTASLFITEYEDVLFGRESLESAEIRAPLDVLTDAFAIQTDPDTEPYTMENLDAAFIRHLDLLQLTEYGESLLVASQPELLSGASFSEACAGAAAEPGVGILGCYYPASGRIYVFDISDDRLKDLEPVITAHEMLHAAWEELSKVEQEELYAQLNDVFADLPVDHPVRDRFQVYLTSRAESIPTELHSILGTELGQLTPELETYYAQYFTDRSRVVTLAESGYSAVRNSEAEAKLLVRLLDEQLVEIESLKSFVASEALLIEKEVETFNQTAQTPGGFVSEAEYNAARSQLEEQQQSLQATIENLNDLVVEYNNNLEVLRALNDLITELNMELNVQVPEPANTVPGMP